MSASPERGIGRFCVEGMFSRGIDGILSNSAVRTNQSLNLVLIKSRVALFLLGSAVFLRAQSSDASLAGRISDPSHALISDAKIAAVSEGTSVRYETASDSSGEYYLGNLPPGDYRIEVEKTGFKKLVKQDVLHVQDALALDFEMTVGESSQTVNVEAGAPLVNTESGTVSTVVAERNQT